MEKYPEIYHQLGTILYFSADISVLTLQKIKFSDYLKISLYIFYFISFIPVSLMNPFLFLSLNRLMQFL